MEEIEEILEEQGLSKDDLEAALELGRLISGETGLCCDGLGKFVWSCYRRLAGEA
jgi:hypothetical protein